MKTLCLIQNVWKERVSDAPRSVSLTVANQDDADAAHNLYSKHMIPGADIISVEVFLPAGNGIINCRVNSEHKQVRF
jgi:hypothetical protein